jgi:hypothetical protein
VAVLAQLVATSLQSASADGRLPTAANDNTLIQWVEAA